jgi:DNA (cytosine-5)-methyltransferase 1
MIETVNPATVIIENVVGFAGSSAGELLRIKLRKWGYHVTEAVLDARQYKGITSRKRYYMVASVWPGFSMPEAEQPVVKSIWPMIERHLDTCRDITHTSTVHLGVETGRARLITRESTSAPTVTKSQARQAKDSVVISDNGRYYLPSEELLRELNGFPKDVNLNSVSSTIASEIIGQSIEYPMHHQLMMRVRDHIALNV